MSPFKSIDEAVQFFMWLLSKEDDIFNRVENLGDLEYIHKHNLYIVCSNSVFYNGNGILFCGETQQVKLQSQNNLQNTLMQ